MRSSALAFLIACGFGTYAAAQSIENSGDPSGYLAFSAAYSERFKESVGVKLVGRNLLRRGINANLGAQRNDLGYQWNAGISKFSALSNTSLPGNSVLRFGLKGHEYAWEDTLFNTKRQTLYIGSDFSLGAKTSLSLGVETFRDELSNIAADASPLISGDAGSYTSTGITSVLRFGDKKIGSYERKNFRAHASAEYFGLTGNAQWSAVSGAVAFSTPITSKSTLKISAEGGMAQGGGGYSLRITDRAFLSSDQLRGFDFAGVGPVDTNGTTVTPLGGRKYATFSVEMTHQVRDFGASQVSASVFFDAGSVWDLENVSGGVIDPVDDSFFMRQSAGISLNLESEWGALSISLSEPIRQRDTDRTQKLSINFDLGF